MHGGYSSCVLIFPVEVSGDGGKVGNIGDWGHPVEVL